MEGKFISNNQLEHRELEKQTKKWYKKFWGVLLLSVVSLLLIFITASVFFVVNETRTYMKQGLLGEGGPNVKIYSRSEIEGAGSHSFGTRNPKVTIVLFSDFSCPNSRSFSAKTKDIRIKYYNYIKIIHRDFPVISEQSEDLALAARCAGEQGLFWAAHDMLYEKQGVSTKAEIFSLMLSIGAEEDKLAECLDTGKYLAQVKTDLADGIKLGIKGTPTWFINGYRADGDMPEEMLNDIIENILFNN